MTRTDNHINSLMATANRISAYEFRNGASELNVNPTAATYIKECLTTSQIKTKLKSYNKFALNLIAESSNTTWADLAKKALTNY